MSRVSWNRSLLIVVALVLLTGSACPGDPAARVAKARSEYDVRLTNFLPQYPEPMTTDLEDSAGEAVAVAAEAVAGVAEVAEVEVAVAEEAAGEEEEGPAPISVLFDLVIHFAGAKSLPGITVEIIQNDAAGNEKAHRRHYVETPNIRRGSDQQIAFQLDDLEFEDGDSFGVALPVVAEADRASYREFMEAGG